MKPYHPSAQPAIHQPDTAAAADSRVNSRRDRPGAPVARDPLSALEAARRRAFEEEEAERWDGLS